MLVDKGHSPYPYRGDILVKEMTTKQIVSMYFILSLFCTVYNNRALEIA